jgi:site-specific DNA recombinase
MPLLGYDVDPQGSKLRVNEAEAERVRAIFDLYLQHEALLPVVAELECRGWHTKRWTTRKGRTRGGLPFIKTNLHQLLTRVAYVGKIQYRSEVHPGEHPGIVAPDVWERVQALLRSHGRRSGPRLRSGALLGGLLRCVPCGCRMSPTFAIRRGGTRYRYYVCANAQRRGWHHCPSKSISAASIERFAVEQIRSLADDPDRVRAMIADLADDDHGGHNEEDSPVEVRPDMIRQPTWDELPADQKAAVLRGLIQDVDYDGTVGKVTIRFRPDGLRALAQEGQS